MIENEKNRDKWGGGGERNTTTDPSPLKDNCYEHFGELSFLFLFHVQMPFKKKTLITMKGM